jgi:hypothetical protein
MPHKIRILETGIVEIVHTGDMTIVEATASRNEASAIMMERDLHLVLADVSQTNHDDSTMDLLSFNASHYDVFPKNSKLAVVIPSDPSHAAPARFAETVALNRGITMRIFLEYNYAMNWLLESSTI